MKMKLRDPRKAPYKSWLMEVNIDPLDGFDGIKESKLFEATGLIPYFVAELAMQGEDVDTAGEAMEILNSCYGFGLGDYNMMDDKAASMSSEGVYSYTEDPDMVPLVEFKLKSGVTVWVYQYALVCVKDADGNHIMQRMD